MHWFKVVTRLELMYKEKVRFEACVHSTSINLRKLSFQNPTLTNNLTSKCVDFVVRHIQSAAERSTQSDAFTDKLATTS